MPRLGAEKVMRVLPPPEGRMSVSSALRIAIFSTTVPEYSSSTSMITVSYGSVFLPSSSSPNSTRGTGIMNRLFERYGPHKGNIEGRKNGVLISNGSGED